MEQTRLANAGFVDLYLGMDDASGNSYAEIKGMIGATPQLVPAPNELSDDIQQLKIKCKDVHQKTKRTEFSVFHDERLYRVTVAKDLQNNETFIIRQTPNLIRPIDKIGLTRPLIQSVNETKQTGLVLISGQMGQGKTSTAASIISQRIKITGLIGVSIEDPIETLLQGKHGEGRCIQLEVSENEGYASATKKAFRMGATTFLLGEIRDSDTANEVLKASLSMFVVATIHASSVIDAIDQYIMFCESGNKNAAGLVAKTLYIVTHQSLTPRLRDGVVVDYEVNVLGFNIKNAVSKGLIQSKIAAGETSTLSEQFNQIQYDFSK